ncbi:MAG: non-canonical purine NTP pyrophosphatase [Ruminococcaceae bacterium]|nr:non-canonical purine NTP pyrophosphatase [Oscillospiraceae bacterium]MBO4971912.1 non-canonical purine NTP pyrophosphatase [Clostridia bacterium]
MKVLIGTTNPSKVKRFSSLLSDCDIDFITLKDINVDAEPQEQGKTPEENAIIKAKYYGQYFDRVICNDSGLYFDCMSLDDARQPGLNIRTPNGCERLGEEEMISYYSDLVRSLGGRALAFYLDGIAVFNCGRVYSFMENGEATRASAFYMIDTPSDKRHPGWPLDSISLNRNTLTYFVDEGNNKYDTVKENIMIGEYRKRLIAFLKSSLDIERQ